VASGGRVRKHPAAAHIGLPFAEKINKLDGAVWGGGVMEDDCAKAEEKDCAKIAENNCAKY